MFLLFNFKKSIGLTISRSRSNEELWSEQILIYFRPDLKSITKHCESPKIRRERISRTRKSWKRERERGEVTGVAKDRAMEEDNDGGEKKKKWKLVDRH